MAEQNAESVRVEYVRRCPLCDGYGFLIDWREQDVQVRETCWFCQGLKGCVPAQYDGSAVRSEGEGSAVNSDRSAQRTTHAGPPPPSAHSDGSDGP